MYVNIFGVLSFRSFNLSEPWAVDNLTVSNFRLSINRPFGFFAVGEYNFYACSYRHLQFWICFFIIIHWLMNWLLRRWDFRISISLINGIWIVLLLEIPSSVFFCSGNFSFSALLFHKLLFQSIKFSVFDTSVNKNLYEFRGVSWKIEIKTFLIIFHSEFQPRPEILICYF